MRTKNPFCTGTQLAILRAIKLKPLARIRDIARTARVSIAPTGHALVALTRAGHLKHLAHGRYCLTRTGRLLIECAEQIDYARSIK